MIHILGRDTSQSSPNLKLRKARDLDLDLESRSNCTTYCPYLPPMFRSNRRQKVWTGGRTSRPALLGRLGDDLKMGRSEMPREAAGQGTLCFM